MKGKCPLFDYIDNHVSTNQKIANVKEKVILEMSDKGKELLVRATQEEVKALIKELYRPGAKIGDGGSADALRYEKSTGKKVGDRNHEQKVTERANQIRKILRKNPNHPDKELLKEILNDLDDSLKGGKK